jgi:hypothetical protein
MSSQRTHAHQRIKTALQRHWVGIMIAGIIAAVVITVMPAGTAQAMPRSGIGGNGPALIISSPSPPSGPAGALVVVSGSHWVPGTTVQLSIGSASGSCASTTAADGASGTVDNTGAVQISFTWPSTLPADTYPICGDGPGAPTGGVKSSNSFTELTQGTPSLAVSPTSVTSGGTVSVAGASWVPGGTIIEIHGGPQGGNPCAILLTTITSQSDGTLSGSFTAPTVSSATTYSITATSPAGTCSGTPAPTLHQTTTLIITPSGAGTSGTPTPTTGPATPTPTPTPGHPTPTPGGTGVPQPNRTPTPTRTPGSGGSGGGGANTGPCPPLPGNFCNSNSSFPGWLLCLMVLSLLALFVILLLLLLWRRNQEVIVTEEDITNQIDPNSVTPMGTMRFVRAVRETTQVVDRNTGNVRSSRSRDFDEFVDAGGNIHRRPRAPLVTPAPATSTAIPPTP